MLSVYILQSPILLVTELFFFPPFIGGVRVVVMVVGGLGGDVYIFTCQPRQRLCVNYGEDLAS